MDQGEVTRGAFHEGADLGMAGFADEQVPLPVSGDGAVFDLSGALGDHDHALDVAAAALGRPRPLR